MNNTNNSKLRIIPLGGLEAIGMNITAFEYEDSIVVVDCGLSFPTEDMLGIDLVIPDVSYLKDNIEKVKGFVFTHGHEDHIGAIPYVFKDINAPIYATKLTMGLIDSKLKEHNMTKVVKKKVNNKKKKMSAKQKQALKKAQKASQKSDAKKKRAKSMKVRAKKGLDEGAEEFECPQCGYIGDMEEVEQGVFICPDCDAELEIDGQVLREELDESKDDILDVYKKALDIPEFIINEGNDLVKKYLKDVFDIDLD